MDVMARVATLTDADEGRRRAAAAELVAAGADAVGPLLAVMYAAVTERGRREGPPTGVLPV